MTGRRRERGAVAVEAALVTPLVLALIFGIIESAFLMKDVLAASSAVRAGVRIASAQPRTTDFAQAAANEVAKRSEAINKNAIEQLWVYKVAAGSDKPIGGSFSGCTVCVTFAWNGSAFVKASDTWAPADQNACPGWAGRPAGPHRGLPQGQAPGVHRAGVQHDRDLGEQHPEPGTDPRGEGCKP